MSFAAIPACWDAGVKCHSVVSAKAFVAFGNAVAFCGSTAMISLSTDIALSDWKFFVVLLV